MPCGMSIFSLASAKIYCEGCGGGILSASFNVLAFFVQAIA